MNHGTTETTEMHQPEGIGIGATGWTWQIAKPVPVSPEQIRREARKYGRTHPPGHLPIVFRARQLPERRAA